MSSCPDLAFADYVLSGLLNGFRIGFDQDKAPPLRACHKNMLSVKQNPEVVASHIQEEVEEGRLTGLLLLSAACHSSPIGLVPKSH